MSKEARLVQGLENQRIMAHNEQVARDTAPERTYVATAGGDHLMLRGIPAIGPSVEGAIIGTRPDTAMLR
jgi:hypothetical protein